MSETPMSATTNNQASNTTSRSQRIDNPTPDKPEKQRALPQRRGGAEGVETAGQLALLAEFGCTKVQGYWFSRAVPLAELERMRAPAIPDKDRSLRKRPLREPAGQDTLTSLISI